jgi:high-affinity Fe2+/Pb2+ permease
MLKRRRRVRPRARERRQQVTSGLILLVFIGLLIAFFFSRGRRRLGLSTKGQTWLIIIAAVVLIGLMLWASSTRR